MQRICNTVLYTDYYWGQVSRTRQWKFPDHAITKMSPINRVLRLISPSEMLLSAFMNNIMKFMNEWKTTDDHLIYRHSGGILKKCQSLFKEGSFKLPTFSAQKIQTHHRTLFSPQILHNQCMLLHQAEFRDTDLKITMWDQAEHKDFFLS